uniref:uncharacterized protein LOC120337862 n=1 Tax=Styela clava TaxID=7725 RepID=UPI00193A84DE|nr:uncharacterized protein LOC120337862 [Styela clava]
MNFGIIAFGTLFAVVVMTVSKPSTAASVAALSKDRFNDTILINSTTTTTVAPVKLTTNTIQLNSTPTTTVAPVKPKSKFKRVIYCQNYCEWNHFRGRYLGKCVNKRNKFHCHVCRKKGCKKFLVLG